MNNHWNKFIYKLGSGFYDQLFNSGLFLKARKQIFSDSIFKVEGQRILFVGVGTGADLELLDIDKFDITAIDYSEAMLQKAREKFNQSSIEFLKMDAQDIGFADAHFDLVVASLIMSVVPDENRCFREIVRVLKPDGKIIIFDKFSSKGNKLPLYKKILRPVIGVLGTDIGRDFEKVVEPHKDDLSIMEDRPILFKGMYRKIVLLKSSLHTQGQ
jgi:phosphatidylethanolamine/phosphatidyl-N-methylethanolamine N-methyltransferase